MCIANSNNTQRTDTTVQTSQGTSKGQTKRNACNVSDQSKRRTVVDEVPRVPSHCEYGAEPGPQSYPFDTMCSYSNTHTPHCCVIRAFPKARTPTPIPWAGGSYKCACLTHYRLSNRFNSNERCPLNDPQAHRRSNLWCMRSVDSSSKHGSPRPRANMPASSVTLRIKPQPRST